jgi:hypothetical protein
MSQNSFEKDVERRSLDDTRLHNDIVKTFAWEGVSVHVKDRQTKQPKCILENSSGYVEAGRLSAMCASCVC